MDKVSVIIPAYNQADYTIQAVESVLAQNYKDIEIIVIDDGSTDDTDKKIEPFLSNNLTYIYQHNQGASAARNRGIKESTGDYLGFLDCDDLYLPGKIQASVNFLKHQNYDMVYNPAILIDKWGDKIGLYKPRRHNLLFRNSIMNSVVIKREVFDKVGVFDEEIFICADWDMWLRISEKYPLFYFDEYLTYYRV